MVLANRMSLRPSLLWLILNLALIIQCLSWNNIQIYIFNFTYPLRCLHVPPGVRVPHVETTDLAARSLCDGFEILIAVTKKTFIFWDIKPCSPVKVNRRFRDICHLQFQDRRVGQVALLAAGFMLVSYLVYSSTLKREAMFLQNIGWLSLEYTALYPRRWYSSI
jgi:hypothetical protein